MRAHAGKQTPTVAGAQYGPVVAAGSDDELPRVTLSMLRRAESRCPRRLFYEHAVGYQMSKLGDAGFDVMNRIVEDATLWHRGRSDSDLRDSAFPAPTDVAPEQRMLYRAIARGYTATFTDEDVEVGDLGWSTSLQEQGVRLVGPVGIPLLHRDGTHELRVLRAAYRGSLLDDTDVRFALLRAREWAPEALRIVAADLLQLTPPVECDVSVADRLDDTYEWLAERVAVIRARQNKQLAVAGADCRACAYIPNCPAVTGRSSGPR